MFWSCESLTCLLLSLCLVFSTMLEFLFLRDFVGAVAPDSFSRTITTSFIGHKFDFYRFFVHFRGVTCFAQILISTGFESCCLVEG